MTDLELVGSPAVPGGAALTDRVLLDRAVGGDARAFGELFARHSGAVHTYCFRRLGTWTAAEDATSVVFLEVWRRRDAVPETLAPTAEDSLLPWFYGVAYNVVRNHARSMRRHRAALERLPRSLREPDPADGVAERLARARAHLREAAQTHRPEGEPS